MIFHLYKHLINSRNESKKTAVFSIITISGLALGVATLIIALSVLRGFEKIITQKVINLDAHIQISAFSNLNLPDQISNSEKIKTICGSNLSSIQPFTSKLAIISKGAIKEGVTIKGVNPDYFDDKSSIETISGELKIKRINGNETILIGKKIADKLQVKVGEKITVYALPNEEFPSFDNMPIIEQFIVGGIFESGMSKYDDTFVYIDINYSQMIFNMYNKVNGYELKLYSIAKIASIAEELQENLRYPHYVRTFQEIYKPIFTWIELQKKPIPIVLTLIIIVAVFNIISTLLMLLLEKLQMIGIIKSLGANKNLITLLFLFRGIKLSLLGIIWGVVTAFVLSYIQIKFDVITLPSEVYFTSKVPLLIEYDIYILVSCVTAILSFLISFIPSRIAASVSPVKALRFS